MEIDLSVQNVGLRGMLTIPGKAEALVIFTHGSGNKRNSSRNINVANEMNKLGLATFQFDLLTKEEGKNIENRFDIDLLTDRLIAVTKWCFENEKTKQFRIGYFGASTGSSAALSAAAYWGTRVKAVVSCGGRPDLAMDVLDLIECPTLLIVGEGDVQVISFNRAAYQKMGCVKKLEIVPDATHLLEEPGALEKVIELSGLWFIKYL